MRRAAFLAGGSLVACALLSPGAQAHDHCSGGELVQKEAAPLQATGSARELGVQVDLSLEHASYETERYAGNYTGLTIGVAYRVPGVRGPAWDVSLDLPAYQLVRNGEDELGLGDPFLGGRLRVWRDQQGRFSLGVLGGLSLPLGDPAADLGMGHFMVHPGLWVHLGLGTWALRAVASYGGVLGGGGHAGGAAPLVNPMNQSEMSLGGGVVWALDPALELRFAGMGAVPVAALGEARATASWGARLLLGKVQVSSTFSLPLVGDPFEEKLEMTVAHAF